MDLACGTAPELRAVDIIFEQPAVNKALEASKTSRLRFVPVSWGRLLPIMGIPSEGLFSGLLY
jgi:hypothetical protein